jgi:hypothetical protein
VTGDDGGVLLAWDLLDGRSLGQLGSHRGAVRALAWSVEGRYILSCGDDGALRLWEARTGRCLRTLDDGLEEPCRIALTADSRHAVIGEESGRIRVVNLRQRRVLRTFEGHTEAVTGLGLSRDGRRAVSVAGDGTLRVWHLDWAPAIRPFAEWDESARPHLEVFLAQQCPRHGGRELRPEWGEADLRRLLSDLRSRGLGWIRPDGVRARLEEMTAAWDGPAAVIQPAGVARQVTPRARQRRRSGLGRALVAAVLAVPLLIAGQYLYSRAQLHYDSRLLKDRRDQNLASLVVPTYMTLGTNTSCDPDQIETYLRDYAEATDSPATFRAAAYCLERLAEPRSVPGLLDMVRPAEPEPRPDPLQIGSDRRQVFASLRRAMAGGLGQRAEIASMLARMGDRVVPAIADGLDDPDREVRDLAAYALALRASTESVEALFRAAEEGSARARRAVAGELPDIACSRELEIEEVFDLAERLARDDDPEVRLAVLESLPVFEGRRPRTLARRLTDDPDPRVSGAAREHLR